MKPQKVYQKSNLGRCSWLVATSRLALIVSITLTVLSTAQAQPTIKTQPKDRFVDPGRNTTFSVGALGAPPFSFQWFYNGAPLADATNNSVLLTNVQPSLNGDYFVVVSDASGSVTSQIARLKVFVSTAHRFSSLQVKPAQAATLALAGETRALFAYYWDLYPVEVSSNLRDWSLLTTLQRANTASSPLTFLDVGAIQYGQRFYRTTTNTLVTAFPELTGPYAVGMFSRVICDPTRTNKYRYNRQTNAFMFTCWYPAEAQAGLLPAAAWDKKMAQDWSARFASASGDSSWTTIIPQFKGHALLEAPAVRGTNRFPVILFSHGYTVWRKANSRDAEELASHGYVVVAVDHEDCWGTEFPDGRYLTSTWNSANQNVPYLVDSRVKDLLCVLDELRRMDANDAWLAGRLDFNRLGTLGMSFGGSSTGNLCRTNDAVKCAAFLDCAFWPNVNVALYQTGIEKPFLAMNNDYASDPNGCFFWPESKHFFDLAKTNAIIFQIRNTNHELFWDPGWYFPMTGIPWTTAPARRTSRVIDDCLVSFFDKYLKSQDDHFLDQAPPKYADEDHEVLNFQRK